MAIDCHFSLYFDKLIQRKRERYICLIIILNFTTILCTLSMSDGSKLVFSISLLIQKFISQFSHRLHYWISPVIRLFFADCHRFATIEVHSCIQT